MPRSPSSVASSSRKPPSAVDLGAGPRSPKARNPLPRAALALEQVEIGPYCYAICGCMIGEMGRYPDQSEFSGGTQRLQTGPADRQVRAELDRLARFCAARIQ